MALNALQYEEIIKDYEKLRDKNRHLLESRREEVYAKLPGYRELEDSISTLSVSAARQLLDGDSSARTRLHDSLIRIRSKQKELLDSACFPRDYLEPVYTCSCCQDTGYVSGKDGLQEKCRCFRQKEISLLYTQSNIQEMIARENFSTLSYEYYQGEDLQHFRAAVELAWKFVQNFRQDYQNLFFYGTVGTGKSFLSGCIAKELLQQGCSVIYFSSSGLFETLARYSFDFRAQVVNNQKITAIQILAEAIESFFFPEIKGITCQSLKET